MTGTFSVPAPPSSDGSWDMYEDFVGGLQFWGFALVSGSGDSAVRMWDSQCFVLLEKGHNLIAPSFLKCARGKPIGHSWATPGL